MTPTPELVVEARLEDPGTIVPARGDQWTIALMRYAVERVVAGTYDDPEIWVGHPDADSRRPEFAVGVHHRLELQRRFPATATLLGTPGRGGAWYCVSMEVL